VRPSSISLHVSNSPRRKLHFRPYVATRLIAASPIPNAFFTLLFSIPNLSEMIFCPQFEYLAQVKEEFYAIEDVLPELDPKLLLMLEALTLPSPEWMFVAEYCPRLKSLEVLSRTQNPWHAYDELDIDIVRLGKTHPDLTKLHCRVTGIRTHVHGRFGHLVCCMMTDESGRNCD